MPRAAVIKAFFNFIAGKHSDGSALTPPENTARILQNVDLDTSGKISRRLGIDYEENFVLSTDTFTDAQLRANTVAFYEWLTVAEDGRRNFFVVRVGEKLYFYNQSGKIISDTLLGTLDISSFSINPSSSKKTDIQVATGKGLLFVSGELYDPFFVTFDTIAETFSATKIKVEVRDFEGVDDGLDVETRPTLLSDLHHYNLLNQGWDKTNIDIMAFPSNADVESIGIKVDNNGDRAFNKAFLESFSLGNTPAPKGHFILEAFDKDRTEASGIFGLPAGGDNRRPRSVAFFAGRVWYGGLRGSIFFSQILEDTGKIGKCYQEQDPTAEDFNELLDTDGGVLSIPEIGEVHKLVAISGALIVIANNGVWQISGGQENFTANTTSVTKVSEVGTVGYKSVVVVEDIAFFWSGEGIFTVVPDNISGRLQVRSISDNRIDNDFNLIPAIAKIAAQGSYDRVQKRIYWSYHDGLSSGNTSLEAKYNAMLVYDVQLNAFYDYIIEDAGVTGHSSFMSGLLKGNARNEGEETQNVVVNGDQVQVNGDNVQTTVTFSGAAETLPKVLTFALSGLDFKITFSEFCSRTFHDWFSQDSSGADFTSIIETNPETLGEGSLDKQATYLTTFYDFKRGGFGFDLTNPRPDPGEGFRVTQNVIEILRKGEPNFRTTQNVVEVLRQGQPNARITQNVIEILRN